MRLCSCRDRVPCGFLWAGTALGGGGAGGGRAARAQRCSLGGVRPEVAQHRGLRWCRAELRLEPCNVPMQSDLYIPIQFQIPKLARARMKSRVKEAIADETGEVFSVVLTSTAQACLTSTCHWGALQFSVRKLSVWHDALPHQSASVCLRTVTQIPCPG